MALETFTYITSLVDSNPASTDPVSQGDDHLRGIKTVLTNSFPNISAPVTATAAQIDAAALNPAPTQMPIGGVMLWTTGTAPSGYLTLPAVPTEVSRTTYAALFAAIGTAWGAGNGSTTFNIPYIPYSRVPGHISNVALAVVSDGQMPAHSHTIPYSKAGITPYAGGNFPCNAGTQATSSTGTGTANMAAQIGFNYCIRYA